jgi:hypothetical protein
MLYMVIEYFNAGAAPEIYRRFRERGCQLPPGLEYVDSWTRLDGPPHPAVDLRLVPASRSCE